MPATEVTHTLAPLRAFPAQPQLILDAEDKPEEKGVGRGCCGRDLVGKEPWSRLPRKLWEPQSMLFPGLLATPQGWRDTRAWWAAMRVWPGVALWGVLSRPVWYLIIRHIDRTI